MQHQQRVGQAAEQATTLLTQQMDTTRIAEKGSRSSLSKNDDQPQASFLQLMAEFSAQMFRLKKFIGVKRQVNSPAFPL
uniref:Uncharacterized protein n=1 Tax=Acrobeloides nanus TaxID=290746 RepID=A0A914CSB8_9BILA